MSVTRAVGFTAAGVHCGIKGSGALDLAVVRADSPANAAAVFTTSTTAAPSIEHGRASVADGTLQAFVVASGCANAGTGTAGLEAQREVAGAAAEQLEVSVADVLLSSTGPIGPVLPVETVTVGLKAATTALEDSERAGTRAATAIHTTDTSIKQAVTTGEGWTVGGMAKGAGMVRPDMATMLAYLTTDAVVGSDVLVATLGEAVDVTFNCLNIDGCQSTNDTVAIMASGASGIEPTPEQFAVGLADVCRDLSAQMAADAEGATRVVTIRVGGAGDDEVARQVGRAIADAALVRASFYGGDPNWGRLLAAAGVAGHDVGSEDIDITYEGVAVARSGVAVRFDEEALVERLADGDFAIDMSIGDGPGSATVVTTDLTPEYVVFNGERS